MHRGEVSIEEAADFLVEHTGFERPNALAEARRYTYTPTYNLSYLLGKVLLLELRRRAAASVTPRCARSTTRSSVAAPSRSASTAGLCSARAPARPASPTHLPA